MEKSSKSVVSHILSIREKMEGMSALMQENLEKAQEIQKSWYDKNARQRVFNEGGRVLVLLPMSTNALMAQWQGPYMVLKQVGKAMYCIDMTDVNERGCLT